MPTGSGQGAAGPKAIHAAANNSGPDPGPIDRPGPYDSAEFGRGRAMACKYGSSS